MSNKENLFADFSPAEDKKWMELLKSELERKAPNSSIEWVNNEGIELKSYYRESDLNATQSDQSEVGVKKSNNNWWITEEIDAANNSKANKKALHALERGASAIDFDVKEGFNLDVLVKDIYIDAIPINWKLEKNYLKLIESYSQIVEARKLKKEHIQGALLFDPIGDLISSGNWETSKVEDFNEIENILAQISQQLPAYKALTISGEKYNSAGASIIQELGCMLAHANEYIAELTSTGLDADEVISRIQFTVAIGSDYFLEIAKLRALKLLWKQLTNPYTSNNFPCIIRAVSSAWNLTIYDPYVNILRTTTSAMSAILGGCNSLNIKSFDSAFKKENDFSKRIARNIQNVVQDEAHFNKVIDPAAGSYYIETLTDKLSRECWKFFQQIEADGGLLKSLELGSIQKKINEVSCKKQDQANSGDLTVLGVNKHPNTDETMSQEIDLEIALSTSQNSNTTYTIEPLREFRLVQELETKRLNEEKR